MLKNYLKTAFRKLLRNKSYTLINVGGLSMGMACALLIFQIIRQELSQDTFHAKRDRIYRINTVHSRQDGVVRMSASQFPLIGALRLNIPELEKATLADYENGGLFSVSSSDAGRRFQENTGVAFLEPEFFEIFDYPWLEGDPRSLKEPNTIALTESIARKFFPTTTAMGQTVRYENKLDLKVAGIVRDFPDNTDFPFTVIISYSTLKSLHRDMADWKSSASSLNTYVLLPESLSPSQMEERLTAFIKNNLDQELIRIRRYELQPLSDIHFDTQFDSYNRTMSKDSLLALALIGIFLILTACINFINFATAQASQRAHEIGVRKVVGAGRGQLIAQFLGETFLITLLSAVLAMVWAELAIPVLNVLLDSKITAHLLNQFSVIGFLSELTVIVAVSAGFYPALVLSRYEPTAALKCHSISAGRYTLRQALVALQFAISQFLIIGVIAVKLQTDYLVKKDMGFNKEGVLTVPIPASDKTKLDPLRNQLTGDPHILQVSYSFAAAASPMRWTTVIRYPVRNETLEIRADMKPADPYYLSTYGLELVAGRNVTESDSFHEFIINEKMVEKLGFHSPQEAVGKTLNYDERMIPIVGVVKDFNLRSLHREITPCILGTYRENYQQMNIKIHPANVSETLALIERKWSETFPENVFAYEFIDQSLARFYNEERRISNLFEVFAGLAIAIGCMGLLGLVTFIAARRTKEIGVRKVLGATVTDILMLLSREFLALIAIAFAVSAPIAYVVMDKWLQNFAYRVSLGAGIFGAAVLFSLAVAGATVGYRALKAAAANPVDALKYE